jgi:hypothetical protein
MNATLQNTVTTVQQLSYHEQWQLVQIIVEQLQKQAKQNPFWQSKTMAQIQQLQGKKSFKTLGTYQADFLPEAESTDDWINYFSEQHHQDATNL